MNIPFKRLAQFFEDCKADEERISKKFGDAHTIYYESLVENQEHELTELLNFLNLKTISLETKIRKLGTQTLAERIVNYPMLKKRFEDSEYAHFFTE